MTTPSHKARVYLRKESIQLRTHRLTYVAHHFMNYSMGELKSVGFNWHRVTFTHSHTKNTRRTRKADSAQRIASLSVSLFVEQTWEQQYKSLSFQHCAVAVWPPRETERSTLVCWGNLLPVMDSMPLTDNTHTRLQNLLICKSNLWINAN